MTIDQKESEILKLKVEITKNNLENRAEWRSIMIWEKQIRTFVLNPILRRARINEMLILHLQ